MKYIKVIAIVSFLSLIFLAGNAHAKWWIFGQSQDEIAIRYLYLNKVSL